MATSSPQTPKLIASPDRHHSAGDSDDSPPPPSSSFIWIPPSDVEQASPKFRRSAVVRSAFYRLLEQLAQIDKTGLTRSENLPASKLVALFLSSQPLRFAVAVQSRKVVAALSGDKSSLKSFDYDLSSLAPAATAELGFRLATTFQNLRCNAFSHRRLLRRHLRRKHRFR